METARGGVFRQLRVQAVGDRLGIARRGSGHLGVEPLGLGLAHAVVVVARRSEQQVVARALVELRGIDRRVENGAADLAPQGVQRPELLLGDGLDRVEQIPFGEFGRELVVRIVMVDAVGEPHFLEVLLERLPLGRRAVAAEVFVDDLQRPAHRQVRRTVLVVEDVAAALGRLGQVIDEFLLLQREVFESGDFVADHLDVVEAIDDPGPVVRGGRAARSEKRQCESHGCVRKGSFHRLQKIGRPPRRGIPPRRTA